MERRRRDVVTRPGEFGLRDNAQHDCHTLSLVGELDLVTAPELQTTINRLCKDGAREIVLDLHELTFIDSTGLRTILAASQVCERHGCDFSLIRVQPPAQRLFELTGLVGRLTFRGRALTKKLSRRRASASKMPAALVRPAFEISLDLHPRAPRSARSYVRDLLSDDASQDLREAVMLLTSELVTRTVLQRTSDVVEAAQLRVWLRADRVRVELRVPSELQMESPQGSGPDYDRLLLDRIADRWSIDNDQDVVCVWFELDRGRAHRDIQGRQEIDVRSEPGDRAGDRDIGDVSAQFHE